MFVGREKELETLENLYGASEFQMVVMYGRRRIGKTTLISQFIENKPAIFFTAQEVNDSMNLEQFSKKIYNHFAIPMNTGSFKSWNDAFSFLASKGKESQFILAFDEFPYAAAANHGLKSILQASIDHEFLDTGIFLILCGSHMGFMENEVLGYNSPLFGRRTAQIKLEGFDFYDASKLLSGFSWEDQIKFYSCIGGTPHYLSQIKNNQTFEDNIKRLYFDISGYLYNEPMMLLQQELREPAMYNSIISAVAAGASRLNEIATKINEDSPKVNKYLQTLVNLHIVKKEYPFGESPENSRKGIYLLTDNCYRFWYKFIFMNKPEIENGNGDIVADYEVFGDQMSTFIGRPFEKICMQYLSRKNRKQELPFMVTSFGAWWGNDPEQKAQTDIDIIAANRTNKQIILGECKWKNSFSDVFEIEKLLSKSRLLSEYKDQYYYFFSKIAFSEAAKRMETEKIRLITTEELFKI